jgi:hypothetical protein
MPLNFTGLLGLTPFPSDLSERAVIVNALLIQCVNTKPGNARIFTQLESYVSDDILYKHRIFVSLHRDVALVFALKQWVYW